MGLKEGKTLKTLLGTGLIVATSIFSSCEKPEPPEPPVKKSIEQSVVLNNDVEIKYTATLSNVDKAELNVKREGVLISTEEISDRYSTGTDYSKTFSYTIDPQIKKGNYEFTLTSDNLEKKNSIEIPNYKPTGNFTNLNLNLNQGSEINVTLPNTPEEIYDKNPEDNPVPYINAKSLDGKTQLTLNGSNLKINALPIYTGPYEIEVEYGSIAGGLEKSVLYGNIAGSNKIIVDFLNRPNRKDLNWYGSGDADKNNSVGILDWSRMNEIYAGTFSNPSDTRLYDRIDINGDNKFNEEDIKIVYDRVMGIRAALPGEWGKITPEQRFDWVIKMFAIDKTNNITWTPEFDCTKFVYQTNINFKEYSQEDISNIRTFYSNFNFSDNGRFNLPLYELQLVAYDSQGNPLGDAHDINIIFIYDNIPNYSSTMRIEPQNDTPNPDIVFEEYLAPFANNSKLYIRGSPITSTTQNEINSIAYVTYKVENGNVTLESVNPDVELVTERED